MNEQINAPSIETDPIMNIDLSPFDYEEIKKGIVHSINKTIGAKD
jgi:hypothetical protein